MEPNGANSAISSSGSPAPAWGRPMSQLGHCSQRYRITRTRGGTNVPIDTLPPAPHPHPRGAGLFPLIKKRQTRARGGFCAGAGAGPAIAWWNDSCMAAKSIPASNPYAIKSQAVDSERLNFRVAQQLQGERHRHAGQDSADTQPRTAPGAGSGTGSAAHLGQHQQGARPVHPCPNCSA
ncbi:hypothetical protein SAMN05421693_11414 [Ectothiorhodospira magna]|uniref:Uncharacterized protein n=1 Tax=Ectothiorhodospira magna TaxID=867345 RepID=A0A1H9CIW4_9GAMM|nr:hypothetical protein SAMN05421693_11414 [Ectothiorhodospira magna]